MNDTEKNIRRVVNDEYFANLARSQRKFIDSIIKREKEDRKTMSDFIPVFKMDITIDIAVTDKVRDKVSPWIASIACIASDPVSHLRSVVLKNSNYVNVIKFIQEAQRIEYIKARLMDEEGVIDGTMKLIHDILMNPELSTHTELLKISKELGDISNGTYVFNEKTTFLKVFEGYLDQIKVIRESLDTANLSDMRVQVDGIMQCVTDIIFKNIEDGTNLVQILFSSEDMRVIQSYCKAIKKDQETKPSGAQNLHEAYKRGSKEPVKNPNGAFMSPYSFNHERFMDFRPESIFNSPFPNSI